MVSPQKILSDSEQMLRTQGNLHARELARRIATQNEKELYLWLDEKWWAGELPENLKEKLTDLFFLLH